MKKRVSLCAKESFCGNDVICYIILFVTMPEKISPFRNVGDLTSRPRTTVREAPHTQKHLPSHHITLNLILP